MQIKQKQNVATYNRKRKRRANSGRAQPRHTRHPRTPAPTLPLPLDTCSSSISIFIKPTKTTVWKEEMTTGSTSTPKH